MSFEIKRNNSLPILYVRGTYYEVGYHIGKTFRSFTQQFVHNYSFLNHLLVPFYNTRRGREEYNKTLTAVQNIFPHYLDELKGLSEGADVPFFKLFLLLSWGVLFDNECSSSDSPGDITGCSSVLVNFPDNKFLGHNEDADVDVLNCCYIVHAHIVKDIGSKDEKFMAYCYPGDIPGFCMGTNHYGLTFSVNVLRAAQTIPGKIPRHFLCRALLACSNIDEAIEVLRNKGCGGGDGFRKRDNSFICHLSVCRHQTFLFTEYFSTGYMHTPNGTLAFVSINMVYLQEKVVKMCNIEVAPNPEEAESIVDVHYVKEDEWYQHFNKYCRVRIPQMKETSSDHREETFHKLPHPVNKSDLLNILGDESDTNYPIFRTSKESCPDKFMTVAVGLFDFTKNTWSVYTDNPKEHDPLQIIPLLTKQPNS